MILTRVRRSVAAMIGSVERNSETVVISLKQVVTQKSLIKEKKAEKLGREVLARGGANPG